MAGVSLAQMWQQLDRDRQDAAALANLAMAHRAAAKAQGDAEAFGIYDGAARRHRHRAACLLAVQTVIGRAETSEIIRAELDRLDAADKTTAEQGGDDRGED